MDIYKYTLIVIQFDIDIYNYTHNCLFLILKHIYICCTLCHVFPIHALKYYIC